MKKISNYQAILKNIDNYLKSAYIFFTIELQWNTQGSI